MTEFYKIYHGNLAFSAVEEESIPEMIDKCYFPLLNFIEQTQTPVGLELSAYSLEKINLLRPDWITQFKALHKEGLIELIGSGYMQIIGPLVPYQVNLKNQIVGLAVYQQILGIKPTIAYVNEQTLSQSMIDIYHQAGYQAISMEWNNAYHLHSNWIKDYAFTPIMAQGLEHKLPILWTDSIIFQKFQRTVHNEDTIQNYLSQIKQYIQLGYKALPIYSSDLEIFDYRPGRFETEATIEANEWINIEQITTELKKQGKFALPSSILAEHLHRNLCLTLPTTESPIIVKKQQKYALSRWAACGRGANHINLLCYRFFQEIKNSNDELLWKKLLQYWGSDYRTHTTLKKWQNALNYLQAYQAPPTFNIGGSNKLVNFNISHLDNKIIINHNNQHFHFLPKKGLCLEQLTCNGNRLPIGTVSHGELDSIHHGADFYTGTTVIDSAEYGRITDLNYVENITLVEHENKLVISARMPLKKIGAIEKSWTIDVDKQKIVFQADITLNEMIKGSMRAGTITYLTRDTDSPFWYQCHNGGQYLERFDIDKYTSFEHGKTQSLIQSSHGGLGVTEGLLEFGESNNTTLSIQVDKNYCAPFVMLQNTIDNKHSLTRVFFSLQELDNTSKDTHNKEFHLKYAINY